MEIVSFIVKIHLLHKKQFIKIALSKSQCIYIIYKKN